MCTASHAFSRGTSLSGAILNLTALPITPDTLCNAVKTGISHALKHWLGSAHAAGICVVGLLGNKVLQLHHATRSAPVYTLSASTCTPRWNSR